MKALVLALALLSPAAFAFTPEDCSRIQAQLTQVKSQLKDLKKRVAPGRYPENQLYYRAIISLENQERALEQDLASCR